MKHIIKKAFLRFAFVFSFSLMVELVLLPLLLTLVFNQVFTSFSVYFTDWGILWVPMVCSSFLMSLILSGSAAVRALRKSKVIVDSLPSSGVTFSEAAVLVDNGYRSGEEPYTWDTSDFTKDLWAYRQRGYFK